MTPALSLVGVLTLAWLIRIALRGVREWRVERALRRRELQIQRFVMGPIHGTKEPK